MDRLIGSTSQQGEGGDQVRDVPIDIFLKPLSIKHKRNIWLQWKVTLESPILLISKYCFINANSLLLFV